MQFLLAGALLTTRSQGRVAIKPDFLPAAFNLVLYPAIYFLPQEIVH
jgi:hypothetical protein